MKINIKHYDLDISIEEDDGVDSDTLLSLLVSTMYTLGYHPNSIEDSIINLYNKYNNENLCSK